MQAPKNKKDFYSRWLLGEFGNRPHCWLSLDDLKESGFQGKVSVRSRIPGGELQTKQIVTSSLPHYGVVFQESLPDQFLVIQASMGRDNLGLWLEYNLKPNQNFRQAMTEATMVRGLRASMILRRYVDPSSLDDLQALTTRFPNAVIEFATFSVPVGIYPHRKTVVFEVREY